MLRAPTTPPRQNATKSASTLKPFIVSKNISSGYGKSRTAPSTPKSDSSVEDTKIANGVNAKRITSKLDPPVVPGFGKVKHDTTFGAHYSSHQLPCHIQHGSVQHKLIWNVPIEHVQYDPVFLWLCEGLRETRFPYTFIVAQGLLDLITHHQGAEKLRPLIPRLSTPLRAALTQRNPGASAGQKKGNTASPFATALHTLKLLARALGPELMPLLPAVVPPLASKVVDRNIREDIMDVLRSFEEYMGPGAVDMLKKKCPTYVPVWI